MQRISSIQPDHAQGKAKELMTAIKTEMGSVPNLFKVLAHSPAALQSYLSQSKALAGGVLPPPLREQLALAVAGTNGCDYCASAHTLMGKGAGVVEAELKSNLQSQSSDSKTQAALQFARKIVETRGRTTESDLAAVRNAGFSDAAIVEIITHVGMNIFTNYFNHIAETDVDFPRVDTSASAAYAKSA